jgi:hypothetical protein
MLCVLKIGGMGRESSSITAERGISVPGEGRRRGIRLRSLAVRLPERARSLEGS